MVRPQILLLLCFAGAGPDIILTQLPLARIRGQTAPATAAAFNYGEGARIIVLAAGSSPQRLAGQFHSACDPAVSFDGKRILFAGKPAKDDAWNIYEMGVDGSGLRQITRDLGDCRSPVYLSTLYTIVSEAPWYTIAFTSTAAGELSGCESAPAAGLYSCKLDGSNLRRLTFNPAGDFSPFLMQDGRLLFSGRLCDPAAFVKLARTALFAVNIDGTDYSAFSGNQGGQIQHMACTTPAGRVLFVESATPRWDGSGHLASLKLRRNLHSYERITAEEDGLFCSPSPLPDGRILVSRRPQNGTGTHAVYRFDPSSKAMERIFDDPGYHDIQAKILEPRAEPDGRSSVVDEQAPSGKLYCLNVYRNDLENPGWMPPGTAAGLRVLEGVPWTQSAAAAASLQIMPENGDRTEPAGNTFQSAPRMRLLGMAPVESDGSFNIEVPADTPIQLQLLDADGVALRTCRWIWVKNRESRGCIGCHEDGELTPPNRFVKALAKPSIPLTLPPGRRRSVDFRRDVLPILHSRCASQSCHGARTPPLLGTQAGAATDDRSATSIYATLVAAHDGPGGFRYLQPGQARCSPLVWHLLGRSTVRPWDPAAGEGTVKKMPPGGPSSLTEEEARILIEWIDMGAPYSAVQAEKDKQRK